MMEVLIRFDMEENMLRHSIKRVISLLLIIMTTSVLPGCSANKQPASGAKALNEDEEISSIISGMTTQDKLAQMMIVSFGSDDENAKAVTGISGDYADMIQKYDFGGIILYADNMTDIAQTVTMIHDCQEAAGSSACGTPMLMCVEQEGGMGNSISFGTAGPGNMALAAAGDISLAQESANMIGEEIKALGFHVDFAPVADVGSNPANPLDGVRVFSDRPEMTSEYVAASVKGLEEAGVSSVLKSFPGQGNVGENRETHLPNNGYRLDAIRATELVPFKAGAAAGADMVLTGHIQCPQIEKETYPSIANGKDILLPASMSHTIITDVLRGEMGFDGIVITDAMVADAVAAQFDPIDAAVLAINAGADILLRPVDLYKDEKTNTFPDMDKYMQELLARVDAGEISAEELDDSVFRILKLKKDKGILTNAETGSVQDQIAQAQAVVGTAAHHAREWEIAQAGMTLPKNEGSVLPFDGNRSALILYPSESTRPSIDYALARLQKEGLLDPAAVNAVCYEGLTAGDAQMKKALQKAEQIMILSENYEKNKEISKVIRQLHKENKKAALICLNLPYDAAFYEDADAVLCAYQSTGSTQDEDGNGPFCLNTAAALCTAFGQSVPSGKLPVDVPFIMENKVETIYDDSALYDRGMGLRNWGKK